jgi:phosphoketolase
VGDGEAETGPAATVWRQDHKGFTHQDPGFRDLVDCFA